jgi:hypothetical protein
MVLMKIKREITFKIFLGEKGPGHVRNGFYFKIINQRYHTLG